MAKTNNVSNSPSPSSMGYAVSKYATWFKHGATNDQTSVSEDERRARQQSAAQMADEYYEFSTNTFERGWSKHFHFTPFAPNESIEQAQAFFEHQLAWRTGLKKDMKVLDVGCGIGSPAREIAKFIGCEIVGISINQAQINRAIELTAQEGLTHLCTFVKADFLNLPFAAYSFDAAYAIEATVHAPEYAQVYAQISKILKPGAPFGLVEWVLAPEFDMANSNHIGIRNRIEHGNGVSNLSKVDVARAGLLSAGFEINHEEDYADHWVNILKYPHTNASSAEDQLLAVKSMRTHEDSHPISPIVVPFSMGARPAPPPTRSCQPYPNSPTGLPRPYYFPLQARSHLAKTKEDKHTANKMKPFVRKLCYGLVWVLEKVLHVYPKGGCDIMNTMGMCVDSVVEGAVEGVFTPSWWFICRKTGEPVMKDEWVCGKMEGKKDFDGEEELIKANQ